MWLRNGILVELYYFKDGNLQWIQN